MNSVKKSGIGKVLNPKKGPRGGFSIRDGVTQGLLGDWTTCRKKCLYRLLGWRSPETSAAMDYGSLFHFALNLLYKEGVTNWKDVERRWLDGKMGECDLAVQERNLASGSATFPVYQNFWRAEDARRKWLEVEEVFEYDFQGVVLRGRVDGVFKDSKSGDFYLLETKTKSDVRDDAIANSVAFDFQSLFYITALREKYPGLNKVIYNVIRSPSYKADDPGELHRKVKEDLEKQPERWFYRYHGEYSEARLKDFRLQLEAKLYEFSRWCSGFIPTYRNESACVGRGTCTFLQACASGTMVGYVGNGVLFRELLKERE
jgi:hypothetical protein